MAITPPRTFGTGEGSGIIVFTEGSAPPAPSPAPNIGGAPTVGTIPTGGQGIALDTNGRINSAVPLPSAELAKQTLTSTVSSTTATEAAPLDVVTTGSVWCDGAPLIVVFFAPFFECGSAVSAGLSMWRDGVDQGRIFDNNLTIAAVPLSVPFLDTPAKGYHTYTVRLWTSGGSLASVAAGAGGAGVRLPGYLRVTRG